MKYCTRCRDIKSDEAFHKTNSGKLQSWCKDCKREESKDAYHKPGAKEKKREYWLLSKTQINRKNAYFRRTYGINLSDYEQMLKDQNGVCAICNKSETVLDKRSNKPRMLAVDHDHISGKVRGLLCQVCNTTLGKVKENTEVLLNMIKYLDVNNA